MSTAIQLPEGVKQEHVDYLNALRGSGRINMFAAPQELQKKFKINREQAVQIFWYWADNFDQKQA